MKKERIVICPDCGDTAIVKTVTNISDNYKNIYCICLNELCRTETVHSVYFSHYLTPPRNQLSQEALNALNRLPVCERQQLSRTLGGR
ncbi:MULTISPECIES: ogr/Delta-like zinc finger family protein [Citrobacter freundii complex]|uniref:ogr/Delta-like zinc finger family protein n=1 Tax=Citrobacter freundii complex TaxID=1344959 RepID=UPI00295CC37C|nr:ogr/Delta-like zinc finger family protein [Citrobacter freundii]